MGTPLPFGPDFAKIWDEWLQYRRERKLPKYKALDRTFKMIVRDSGENEGTAVRMIEQSMEQNWQGIFKLKNERTTNNSTKPGTSAARTEALSKW